MSPFMFWNRIIAAWKRTMCHIIDTFVKPMYLLVGDSEGANVPYWKTVDKHSNMMKSTYEEGFFRDAQVIQISNWD